MALSIVTVLIAVWQAGYSTLLVRPTTRPAVQRYIQNQVNHHRHETYHELLIELLKKGSIKFGQCWAMLGNVGGQCRGQTNPIFKRIFRFVFCYPSKCSHWTASMTHLLVLSLTRFRRRLASGSTLPVFSAAFHLLFRFFVFLMGLQFVSQGRQHELLHCGSCNKFHRRHP